MKKILYKAYVYLILVFCVLVLLGWTFNHTERLGVPGKLLNWVAEFPSLVKEVAKSGFKTQNQLLLHNKYPGIADLGDLQYIEPGQFLIESNWSQEHDQSTIKLYDLNAKTVVHEWIPDLDDLYSRMDSLSIAVLNTNNEDAYFANGINKHSTRFLHPMVLEDFDVVFNLHHGPLVRMDSSSNIEWILNGDFHHSIEIDHEGNFWVPGVLFTGRFYEEFNIRDDAIIKVSPGGEVLFTRSILDIFIENGYRADEFGDYILVKDLTHLNDIQPVLQNSSHWRTGDLFLSYRQGSTVFLYRPETNEILWKKRGPWLYQHDVDILDSNRISVFGNDVFYINWSRSRPEEHYSWFLAEHNDVYIYDFSTGETSQPYQHMFKDLNIATETQGRCEIYVDDSIFVEETNQGRYLYFSPDTLFWQFGFKYGDNQLLMSSWSRKLMLTENMNFIE